MRPILFQIGPLPISSFGLFLLLAFAVGIVQVRRRAAALGINPDEMLDITLYTIIGGIVMGRLGYVATNIGTFTAEPLRILTIWQDSGLVFYGALVGGALVIAWYARARQIPLLRFLDIFAPALAFGYAVAMIGALLHGLYLGRPTTVPWAVQMSFEQRHPTAVYLLFASLGTYFVLWAQERRTATAGTLILLWLLLHAVSRFVVEFFVDSPAIVGPLTVAQAVNLLFAVGAAAGLVNANRAQPEAMPQPPTR
ncbi:MAG TPA: prolipoprotein diacylglyceryl transferase [bacterium]|nr:prolipoprotein diacylglyceryl transferase [bacterium]